MQKELAALRAEKEGFGYKINAMDQKIQNLEEFNKRKKEELEVVYTNHTEKYNPSCNKCNWNRN